MFGDGAAAEEPNSRFGRPHTSHANSVPDYKPTPLGLPPPPTAASLTDRVSTGGHFNPQKVRIPPG